MNERGWTRSRDELLHDKILEWITTHSVGGLIPDLQGFLDTNREVTPDEVEAVVRTLEDEGLADVARTLGGIGSTAAAPTARGAALMRRIRDRRTDRRARAIAAREALLDWLYQQKRQGVAFPITTNVLLDPRGHFDGDPFTEDEISDAGTHLRDKDLLKASGAAGFPVLRAEITTTGEEVVETHDASLTAWQQNRGSNGQQFVTHFNGPVSGQVGIGTQVTQTQNNGGLDPAAVKSLLDDLRDAVDTEDIEPADKARILSYADVIQAEVTEAEPDKTLVEASAGRLRGLSSKIGNQVLTLSIGALLKYLGMTVLGG